MSHLESDSPQKAAVLKEFRHRLATAFPENARTDLTARAAYSSDASVYRQVPAAVLHPRNPDDLRAALALAADAGIPVTARGGGTSVAGNAIGPGLVIDFSRQMNRILSIDPEERTAVVEPGVILDDLRAAVRRHGLTFGPDPSTHSRCTLGGMIGNNACGSHSVVWGTTADNVTGLRMMLPGGREIDAVRGTSGDPELDTRLRALRDVHLEPLRVELGCFRRQVSGYALQYLLPENGFDIAKALVGSEGTCGLMTQATLRLVEPPAARVLLVLGFEDVYEAAVCAPRLAKAGALTVEGMDADLLSALHSRPGRGGAGAALPPGNAWLYCEVGGAGGAEAEAAAHALADLVPEASPAVVTAEADSRALWSIREESAGIATRMADGGEAWPGWEDSAVPPEQLAPYLRDLHALLRRHGLRGAPFGHFGEGCLHLRTDWKLTTGSGVRDYRAFMEEAATLVSRYGGTLSGEHGDGRARSELLPRIYSATILGAFAAFKSAFDPGNLLNPGVITDPAPLDDALRPGPGGDRLELIPVHALEGDNGSFAAAVRRCVGVGKCRQESTGTMCPSFKATRDEVHSTRGRSRVLAEMLRGDSLPDGWRSTDVRDALDLCLSCKACRSECPVNVDMATYKAEFLHHHYAGRLRPASHYSMGWLPQWSRLAAVAPRAVNAVTANPAAAAALKRLGGIEPRRDIPRFAEQSFRAWFRRRAAPAAAGAARSAPTVVLWPDTFTNFFSPHVGQAAVEVLERLSYRVLLPQRQVCCGLTWHSTGQLKMAKRVLRRTLAVLRPHLQLGHLIVGLEPSCTVMLREEAAALLPDDSDAARLGAATRTMAEFVLAHDGPWPFGRLNTSAVVQPHCHQESVIGTAADREVLARLGVDQDVVSSGCCGLAGNFGFEKGHWEVSNGCAERELYPKVRSAPRDQLVVADGFSCRTQIAQGTDREGLSLAELLHHAIAAAPLPPARGQGPGEHR
ncbi:FAD-binding and (Fe-S)-binding domain-containing protein [Streptomyces sioyaensis]|uniref:FAD-binding and (Fe-S)-binding domain-containing protein n=1 Tax=Streptomyces sioyaensis TaxID=67364 RepID=UPI00367B56B2